MGLSCVGSSDSNRFIAIRIRFSLSNWFEIGYLHKNWRVTIQHTLREGNQCADFLAKMGSRFEDKWCCIDVPPVDLHPLLLADAMGVVYTRK